MDMNSHTADMPNVVTSGCQYPDRNGGNMEMCQFTPISNKTDSKSITFWDMSPCSPLSYNRCFGGTLRLHLQGRRNRFRRMYLQNVVVTQRTTPRLILKGDTLHNNRCINIKSYMIRIQLLSVTKYKVNITVFWDVSSCSKCFAEFCWLHL
jgi:hypothetical protein